MHVDGLVFRIKEIADAAASPLYQLSGRRPWSLGYYTRKKASIESAIDGAAVQPGRQLPDGFGVGIDERVVEYPWLFDRLRRDGVKLGRMLDAGSTLNHDYVLSRNPLRKADLTMMTLAPEKRCYWYDGYSYVFGDFRKTSFADGAFDTIVSISTLEHVGLDNTMLYTSDPTKSETNKHGFADAVSEFRRIIAPGGRCLITVPYGRYENFNWFQLFDGAMIQALIDAFGPSSFDLEFFAYDKAGWRRASQADVANATAFDPHSGRGRLDDNAGCARAIACIEMIR
ncbi:methyltransferase domain-containing protein [Bradyrhizobium genosp. L]|uniref:methyltransferase domain-containing protein n=1 Tax=Bradyrhizobium genosp. L TaxID=83637 RepID=UPI0018A25A55|nr:methyltransferase domain-containing protein [Bradyrhizobium genosp. L]QPF82977.1 methyltransferase domain-containing protein [Bradyrhizobium genosp. L]